jgi:UDP:flavonoid glycosyltransferase YjiC (YdhE family)
LTALSSAGIPQIILPMWHDLYTIAVRVEALGHGIYANRGHETEIELGQLADALARVLLDAPGEPGYGMKKKADELGRMCRAARGDLRAAEVVWKAARGEDLGCEDEFPIRACQPC